MGQTITCYHCGTDCGASPLLVEEKAFCCSGCKTVYQLLDEHALCDYYALNASPGRRLEESRRQKFQFLDDPSIAARFIRYQDDKHLRLQFYLPQIHCSSCLYLLENLHRLDPSILSSSIRFREREVEILVQPGEGRVRTVAELLDSVGYEPYFSLNDLGKPAPKVQKHLPFQLGIAGFCFGNIMLLSFPEYFGIDASDYVLRELFRWLSLLLALPVVFYSAQPFYQLTWKSIRHRHLNMDAPIALAIAITFIRSLAEFAAGNFGYFDSLTGIVFFMLAGRFLQQRTQGHLHFDRDYTSYFPLAVTLVEGEEEKSISLPAVKVGQTLRIHSGELIPADGILTRGKASIDYSFVTGESLPQSREMGELLYAGGKQTGGNIEILVIREVAQTYLASLWNRQEFKSEKKQVHPFTDTISRYFTWVVFAIAILTALYWWRHDAARIWPAVTAIFIIACPCALLLAASFSQGSLLAVFSRAGCYLRSADTILSLADTTHVVFDKTGTLTDSATLDLEYRGRPLTERQMRQLATVAACSQHPVSRVLFARLRDMHAGGVSEVVAFREVPGEGIAALVEGELVKIGSDQFIHKKEIPTEKDNRKSSLHIAFDSDTPGYFDLKHRYRSTVPEMIGSLQQGHRLSLLSGDGDAEAPALRQWFGANASLYFRQSPGDKLDYIRRLQEQGEKVLMIGDGLNDAGAFRQSDTAIALTEGHNNFTPASDAILQAGALEHLPAIIALSRFNRRLIYFSFVFSLVYNIVGLYFAVQGKLSPLVAAILMPASTLSIFLITYVGTVTAARRKGLR